MTYKRTTHSEDWWATLKPDHILRCTANLKRGGRCRRQAAPGTNVCNSHGALAPAVQAAAARRIGMSVDDAVKRLQAMLDDDRVEPRDKVKILHDLLDRGGLGATQKHLVGVGAVDPIETLFQDLLSDPRMFAEQERPAALPALDYAQAALENREIGSDEPGDVVDAELVPDPAPAKPHTVHVEPYKTPKHTREAIKRVENDLRSLI